MKPLKRSFLAALLVLAALPVEARPKGDWSVTRSSDPVTGLKRCVVVAVDQFGSFRYSRMGSLYPFVENNSSVGIIVGVSSGGPYRMPVGDIFWRVDENPYRELKVSETPVVNQSPGQQPDAQQAAAANGTNDAIASAMALSSKLSAAIMSGVTAASGPRATEIIAEMRAGKSLLFRAAAAAPSMGLPSNQTDRVGMITPKGLRPIALDDTFAAGLTECSIP